MNLRSLSALGLLVTVFSVGVWTACSGEGRPICRCASDCGESHVCLDITGHTVQTCLDPSAAAGACVPAGTSNDDAGVEPPVIEPELYDLLWSKRDLAEVEPSTDGTTDASSTASDSAASTSSSDAASSSTSETSTSETASSSDAQETSASSTATDSTSTLDSSATVDSGDDAP